MLKPVLVPEPLWGVSLDHLLYPVIQGQREVAEKHSAALGKLRVANSERLGSHALCAICGRNFADQVDEIWEFEDGVATLKGLQPVCRLCREARNFRFYGRGNMYEAIDWMKYLDGIGDEELAQMLGEAYLRWKRLSSITDWTIRVATGATAIDPSDEKDLEKALNELYYLDKNGKKSPSPRR